MLKLDGIAKAYGGALVLRGAGLCCREGEAVCLAGANAAGKTTLLTIAAGIQKPDSGTVSCNGKIGYVPQEPALLPSLTVGENLRLWYAAAGLSLKELFSAESTETLLGLSPYARQRISRLSGGIKKRTAIACALVCKPACLLMDEPFTALDQESRQDVMALFGQLTSGSKSILFSSHDPAAIAGAAHRVVILREGVIEQSILLAGDHSQRMTQVLELLSRA